MESLPQVFVILSLWGQNPELILGRNTSEAIFFIATFASSVLSAAKGMADFLLNGPCKLLPNDGLFGGMGKMGALPVRGLPRSRLVVSKSGLSSMLRLGDVLMMWSDYAVGLRGWTSS